MLTNRNENEQQTDHLSEGAKKVGKRIVISGGKKLGTLLSGKASLIILGILLIIILVGLFIALITPDMTKASKFESKEEERELVREHLLKYSTLAAKYNIRDTRWLLMFDMALHENQTLLEYNPDETIFHLFTMNYVEYTPTILSCEVETEITDDEGNVTTVMIEELKIHDDYGEIPSNCSVSQEKKIYVDESLSTKQDILDFMEDKNAVVIEGDKEPQRKITVNDAKLFEPVNKDVPYIKVDVSYFGKSIEEIIEASNFDKDQKEHINLLLEMPEAINDLFEEYGVSIYGSYIGSGAYCVQDGVIDIGKISSVLGNAGAFAGYEQVFIDVAASFNIDVVLMISIALHETGNGTSNAVVNKNNPGGLMDPSTGSTQLFIFDTLEDGIEAMGRTLNNRINRDGLTTIESLGAVYAPVGAANDPNNLNQYWTNGVGKNVASLGGLTMNCSSYSSSDIVFSGDVSEIRKGVASVGTRWIGNSTYVFGGGRSQSDINRGWFDCSSFIHWAFKENGVDLGNLSSTSTETLNKMGRQISINEIQVGDLVFWDTYKRDGHVGIYIGNGQFIGAQSSSGVAIVNLNNPYWADAFTGHVRSLLD